MVHYPTRTRLKIFAKAEVTEIKDHPELYDQLDLDEYKFRPQRMIVFNIETYDWNCPQHLTPQ